MCVLNSRLLPLFRFFVFHSLSQYGTENKGRLDQLYHSRWYPTRRLCHLRIIISLTQECLKDLGITIIGDIIAILKHIAQSNQPVSNNSVITTNLSNSRETIVKSTNIPLPQLQGEMAHPEF